jgi:hypothetical protein
MPIELNPEILQARANAYADSLLGVLDSTPNLAGALTLLRGPEAQRQEDILMVCLGLKPYAGYLGDVFNLYGPRGGNLERIFAGVYLNVEPRLELELSEYSHSVWNPDLFAEVIAENKDLVKEVKVKIPGVAEVLDRPSSLMTTLSRSEEVEATILEGVLYGYPREASEKFAEYYPLLDRLQGVVRDTLLERELGLKYPFLPADKAYAEWDNPNPLIRAYNLHMLASNTDSIKDKLLEAIPTLPRQINPTVVQVVRDFRLADVPGTQFFTFGNLTADYERQLREAYQISGIKRDWSKLESYHQSLDQT